MDNARAKPFEIRVEDSVLADIDARLSSARLPPEQGPPYWDAGTNPAYLRDLLDPGR